MTSVQLLDGIGAVADDYDLFLLDQWGVLHNGETAHPAAVAALHELRDAGKSVILISNSSKPSANSVANLDRLGIERGLYQDVVTSGEIAWREMKAGDNPEIRTLGQRCYMFSWSWDTAFVEGLPYSPVDRMEDAEFILLSGTSGSAIGDYAAELKAGADRGLPMICLNRDFVSVSPAGELADCPGTVARHYEDLGGSVRYYGKPGREIYEACLALAPDAGRPVGIGDSLHHDVEGGRVMGIDTVFVASGIHVFDLDIEPGEAPTADRLRDLYEREGVCPTYAMARFAW